MITYHIFSYEDARLQDAYAVRRNVFIEEQQIPASLEIDALEQEAIHLALYVNDVPVGAGRMRLLDGQIAKLERICVKKDYRKQGLGEVIVNAFEKEGKERDLAGCKLNAQESAVPFYQKLGYTITSDMFYDAGIPHYEMKKTLQ